MLPSYTGMRLWRWARIVSRISSGLSSTSIAATSTRAVSTLSTGMSENSSAELRSSPPSSERLPSSVMFSMIS